MEEARLELIRYQIEKAYSKLSVARDLIRTNHFADSIGASYYAVFSAIRGLVMLKKENTKTHEGAIKLFNKHFMKEKMFPKRVNKLINDAKRIRERVDYGDFFIVEKETAESYVEQAERFVKRSEEIMTELLLGASHVNNKNGKK